MTKNHRNLTQMHDTIRPMKTLLTASLLLGIAGHAHADDVFEVCKGESKRIAAGTGQLSIAIVLPDDFPGRDQRSVLFPIGIALAKAEKAKVLLVAEVDAAVKLSGMKQWSDKGNKCGYAPSLVAILGQKYPNVSTAHTTIGCEGDKCELRVDLERHGRPSSERWVRYTAPLAGAKTDLKVIAAAAPKLKAVGVPPDAPQAGLAVASLTPGKIRVRADADGALELDKLIETDPSIAACSVPNRKSHDVRGYWAEWMVAAPGGIYQAFVKPFGGKDPADAKAAECLEKALNKMETSCPRDAKPVKVKAAICM